MAAFPSKEDLIFHSMATRPAVGPREVNKRSEISTDPSSPGFPTLTIGHGFAMSSKRFPEATIWDQHMPIMMLPLGICPHLVSTCR